MLKLKSFAHNGEEWVDEILNDIDLINQRIKSGYDVSGKHAIKKFNSTFPKHKDLINEFKNKTASICACAKNVAEHLPLTFKIEMISSVFKEVKYFIFENDSTDDTLLILKIGQKIINLLKLYQRIIFHWKATRSWYKRVETLAYARNKLLDATKQYESLIIIL